MAWESDEAAREELAAWAETHGPAVRGYLWALTGSPHDADDLCQQVFLRVWRSRDRYREEAKTRAYLLRVADRLARDWFRRRREVMWGEPQWERIEPSDNGESPEERAVRREAGERLAAAMHRLTEPQRRILLLKYYGEMTFAEIATCTELPLGTVLSHAHRGLRKLRDVMAPDREG